MFKTVVWATDGSEQAARALPYAKQVAEVTGAELVVLHVRELLVGRAGGQPVYADEDVTEARLKVVAEELGASLQVVTSLDVNAGATIAQIADSLEADLIVVGTRGRGAFAGMILGSVTQRVLHLATCPVLAIPPHVREPLAVVDTAVGSTA
jgi:nucleotide-binding universal stress UspA family protein